MLEQILELFEELARQLRITLSQFDNNQADSLSHKRNKCDENSNDTKNRATTPVR
jgi:hypothetical protein